MTIIQPEGFGNLIITWDEATGEVHYYNSDDPDDIGPHNEVTPVWDEEPWSSLCAWLKDKYPGFPCG